MNLIIKSLLTSSIFVTSLCYGFPGQPKTFECTLFDGHPIAIVMNDIPANLFKFGAENPKGQCISFGDNNEIPLGNGPFDTFTFVAMGCKKTRNGLIVQPTLMDGAFSAPHVTDPGRMWVSVRWTPNDGLYAEIEQVDKDVNTLEKITFGWNRCSVTKFY